MLFIATVFLKASLYGHRQNILCFSCLYEVDIHRQVPRKRKHSSILYFKAHVPLLVFKSRGLPHLLWLDDPNLVEADFYLHLSVSHKCSLYLPSRMMHLLFF